MTASRPGNPASLRKATAARTAAAAARAQAAIDRMVGAGQPVTFRGVAAAAPASLDFLYHHPDIRQRIEHLRDQPPGRQQADDAVAARSAGVVTALAAELAELKRRTASKSPSCSGHCKPLTVRTSCSAAASGSSTSSPPPSDHQQAER